MKKGQLLWIIQETHINYLRKGGKVFQVSGAGKTSDSPLFREIKKVVTFLNEKMLKWKTHLVLVKLTQVILVSKC